MISEMRDIHNITNKYSRQKAKFKKEISIKNYDDWNVFESWLIGKGRKKATLLKQLGAFKRLLKLYPSENIKELTLIQLVELNRIIVNSQYMTSTKINMQLFLRTYMTLFVDDERKKQVYSALNILPELRDDTPDSDEIGKVIQPADFELIVKNMPNPELTMMVKILYSTGMRVTELYNITPNNVKFIPHKIGGIELPSRIAGYKGGWIYTRGKRTKSKRNGQYLYYMSKYIDELNVYMRNFQTDEYICKYSYSYFLQSIHHSVMKSKLSYDVHPHMFRHTVATRLFKYNSDAIVKKAMNWSKCSNMPAHYSHINKQDVVDALTRQSLKIKEAI